MSLLNTLFQNTTIPYTVGGKTSTSTGGTPLNIQLKLDPNFQRVLVNTTLVVTVGIGVAIVAGFIITKKKR
jgi:hypothetical protein